MAIYHAKDNSFKKLLGNHELFVQFLRDFIPLDILKDISPDDIEDMKERYLPLFQESRESDTVKRIRLRDQSPLFVIALVEHESRVNYRAAFKMFQYIYLLLSDYEREVNGQDPGLIYRKDFKYPPVLPVVFYDGPEPWTAERDFLSRTHLSGIFGKYIPKFEYDLVDLRRYRLEELAKFQDALSLVLVIDRLDSDDDLRLLEGPVREYLADVGLRIPENLRKLISEVITVLLDRAKAPPEVIGEISGLVEKKEYRTMFDVLVESLLEKQRKTDEANERAAEDRRIAEEERRKSAEANERAVELTVKLQELERRNQELERRLELRGNEE
jgi:hypothetical protein